MMAWMDDRALAHSLHTRKGTYFSRSRNGYWVKGETSGNVQEVIGARLDCDGDTILLTVRESGGACHTGDRTCFDADELLSPHPKNPSSGEVSFLSAGVLAPSFLQSPRLSRRWHAAL